MFEITREERKELNRLAIPSLTGCLAETIFGVADQAIIGRTNIAGYAGVGVSANIIYLLTGTIGILSMAFTILFSKAVGEDNKEKAQSIFCSVVTFTIIIGVLFELLFIFGGTIFFSKVYHLSGQALEYACDYSKIAGIGLGINMLLFIFSSYFKNLQKPMVYLYGTIISLVVNFVLDYMLVFGKFGFPKMGVIGAGIGTVAGLFCHLIIYIVAFLKEDYIKYKLLIRKTELFELIKIYIPLLGQDFIESTVFVMIITSFVTSMGVYYVATYNLIETIISFVLMPIYAYSGATLMLVSQAYAKKEMKKINLLPKISILYCFLILLALGGFFTVFSTFSCRVITNDMKLIEFARKVIPIALGIQLFNIGNQVFKYCLQGITKEKWVFGYSTIISAFSCLWIGYFVMYTDLKLYGIYIGLGMLYFLLGVGYFIKYKRSLKV